MVENCTHYNIIIERNDLIGLVEIKEYKLIPLTDDMAVDICAAIKEQLPKVPRMKLSREDIAH